MFISVLGESGVGKRTLVMMIVQEVASMFDVFFGLPLPADSTVDFVLEQIYEGLCVNNQPKEGINDISEQVRRLLAGKRYLVIIGGIPSKTMLSCVRASLPDDNNGSRVLLVLDTEYEEVAWHANSMNNQEGFNGIHMLSRLDEKGSGQLFRSRAFRREIVCNDGSKEDSMMMTNNRDDRYHKIVYDITGGEPGQWEAVLQQLRPGPRMEEALLVQGGDGEGNKLKTEEAVQSTSHANLVSARTTAIERVFWASFEDLPNDLKSCFLYFAASPKNTFWTANEAVQAWIAEGFIKPQKGKTMEELGRSYLMELVLRCLVQIHKMNAAGGIEGVKVHPRLHGFLQSEAREAGFMEVHDMHHVFVPPSVRRLSFMSLGGRYIPFTNKFPKLRPFICWVDKEQQHQSNDSQDTNSKKHGHDLKFLCGSKFLRVIKVQGLMIEKLPNKIGEMIHLRHLGVECKDLKELPSSIKKLLNLQTLNIQETQVEMIDPGFWKIRTLRHVLAEKLTLPETIEEELGELQTLSGVKPAQGGEWKGQKCALHKMPNLRTLKLHGKAHEKHGPALKSALMKMHLLADLSLQGDVIPSSVFTAPSLRFFQTVELDGNVEWPEDGWDGSKVRPNLVYFNLRRNTNKMPQHIREEFDKIIPKHKAGFRRVQEILVSVMGEGIKGATLPLSLILRASCSCPIQVGNNQRPNYEDAEPGHRPYAMAGGGTTICVSTATTTYSFDTLKSEWNKYGDWVLPFSGKAEHVPELGLWFAMSRTSLSRSGLYALDLDLSTAGAGDDASCQPPALYDIGVDLELRDDLFLFGHAVASLGSGRLCVARYFLIMKREHAFDNPIGVFTGVEVVPGDDGRLRVITHKSERFDEEFNSEPEKLVKPGALPFKRG
ncbi:unnamed protein product [Miscanthus lutarioriparius]|uniref:NB-ARC domain-containing protein n=1 Tax=Miscanthus lutarioriparius TaxID=422564 RepID=A0A811PKC6_9POAL|nr:unnamed protein product [Miscanthus lutarioriparius]